MDPQPRLQLAELVRSQGPDFYQDARRVRALLSDVCPDSRAEIAVLVAAVEEDVPQRIVRSSDSLAIEGTIQRLAGDLSQSRGLSLDAARWAVQSWAWVMGAAPAPQDATGQPASPGPGSTPPPWGGGQQAGQTQPPAYQPPPPAYQQQQQPAYQQPPAYQQQPGYAPANPPTESTATAALVIAIIGLFVCGFVGGLIAFIMGTNAQKKIEASGGQLGGLSQAKAAKVIGIIDIVAWAFVLIALSGS